MRWVEVDHTPDLRVVLGEYPWTLETTWKYRRAGDPVPIVVLNSNAGYSLPARLLDGGADDYLTYPFDFEELRARLGAVMRRCGGLSVGCSEIMADRSTLSIRVRQREARVSRKQFEIFVILAERRERWVHSAEIISAVSGTHHDPGTSLVRVQIHALWKALGNEKDCIRCDGHKSYMLTA